MCAMFAQQRLEEAQAVFLELAESGVEAAIDAVGAK